jgi:hypothetical protein
MKIKMEQTAVEWLEDYYIDKEINKYSRQPMDLNAIHALNHIKHYACNQAKEMEKEQMKQIMWDLTDIDMTKTNKGLVIDNMFKKYYNETYKSE